MLRLTREDLLHIAPRPKTPRKAQIWDAYTGALMSPQGIDILTHVAEITTPLRLRHALAQWSGAETGGFSVLYESGAYTKAGILRVFGAGHHSSAITEEEAAQIAAMKVFDDGDGPRAMALFERAYGYKTKIGRGLGNVNPGDGYRFRGLGFDQMTGRDQQQKAANKIGCSLADLAQPLNLLHGACLEWAERGCNTYADKNDAVSIRKLINAGTLRVSVAKINGLPETMRALKATEAVITAADFSDPAPANVVAANDTLPSGPAVEDVPGDNAPWPNNNQADSIYQSREAQGSTVLSVASAEQSGEGWIACLPRAFDRATATGRFSITLFLFALLSDGDFWKAITAMGLTGIGLFLLIKRVKRYFIHGS